MSSLRLIVLPFLCSWLLAFGIGAAQARSLVIERFEGEIQVLPNGRLLVTETIRPRFTGQWNGLVRRIPVEYRTPQGFNYTLLLDPVSVMDERSTPLRYESSRERHYRTFKIWLPSAQDTTKAVVLKYSVENGLKYFEEHDELYWNVTGDEWDVPIESAFARVLLPAGASGIKALVFTGPYGARGQQAAVEITGPEVAFTMARPLAPREGLTAVVGWDKGLVAAPTALDQAGLFLRSNWPLALPVVVLAFMWRLWYRRGRDPRLRPLTIAYEPPDALTPAELGTLIDNSPDVRDITATLVDLAVRGFLRIEGEQQPVLLGLWSQTSYRLHLLKAAPEWSVLKAHEQRLLRGLFPDDSFKDVALADLKNRFYTHLNGISSSLFQQLVGRGYYVRRPDQVKQRYLAIGLGAGIGLTILAAWLSEQYGLAMQTGVLAGLLSGLIIVGFAWIMPARTIRGARTLEKILGFEEFLNRVESDRFRRVVKTPEMFERFLPFAMALGVEQNWVRAFEGIYTQPPDWYQGTDLHAFRPGRLVNDLSRMSAAAGTMLTSAPRSSGGSGFGRGGSSGGFSGGGFGGGGGGGL